MSALHRHQRPSRKRVLFMCGSINQTTQMHAIARELPHCEHRFTPYYGDRTLHTLRGLGVLDFTIMGNVMVERCRAYLRRHGLIEDYRGQEGCYDLVLTCSDLVVPENIRSARTMLVQEGMTDPETSLFDLVRKVPVLPRWIAGTAATGLSHLYDVFCVASDGYRDLFVRKGVDPDRIRVTGIPNFDNCAAYLNNDFPLRGYVLVCTSDLRETGRRDRRAEFIDRAREIAAGRQLVFKLHPNEDAARATREITVAVPNAIVYTDGDTNAMIANSDVLITQYSSTVYIGLALGKEVHSYLDLNALRRLMPEQNASAARNIANECRALLELPARLMPHRPRPLIKSYAYAG